MYFESELIVLSFFKGFSAHPGSSFRAIFSSAQVKVKAYDDIFDIP
jgi:hypothetical protein